MCKYVFVTGADRGLGSAVVKEYLHAGNVVFAGQFMPDWGELQAAQDEFGDRLILVPLDVSDTESVKKAYELVASKTGRLDVLINNAGISGGAGDIMSLENLERGNAVFDVNCMGPLRMVNLFQPLMEHPDSQKRLCFVSSESGSVSVCHRSDGFIYPMTKTALNMLVKLLFAELYPRGYTFRLYHPGWVRSYMAGEKSLAGKVEPEESAASAYRYFSQPLQHEDVLRVMDNAFAVWPF